MNSKLITCVIAGVASSISVSVAQQKYTLSNGSGSLYKDHLGVNLDNQLPASTPTTNGEGQLVQLGYFSTATDLSLFTGTFRPLAQFKSGDSGSGGVAVPNGRISLITEFDTSSQTTNFSGFATSITYSALSSYPASGAPLAIRWYDSVNTSGYYNTVSATNWDWVTPTNLSAPALIFNPNPADGGAVGVAFQDPSNPFVASLIPEPSSYFLVGVGLLTAGVVLVRRRVCA